MPGIPPLRIFKDSDQTFRLRAREDGTEEPVTVLGHVLTISVFAPGNPATPVFTASSGVPDSRIAVLETASDPTSVGLFSFTPQRQDFRDVAAGSYRWQVSRRRTEFGSASMNDVIGEALCEVADRAKG